MAINDTQSVNLLNNSTIVSQQQNNNNSKINSNNQTVENRVRENILKQNTKTAGTEEKNAVLQNNLQGTNRSGTNRTAPEGSRHINPEDVNFEYLAEINPGNGMLINENRESKEGMERFQIEQINRLNAEISRSAGQRFMESAPRTSLQQDNQLGGKINTVI